MTVVVGIAGGVDYRAGGKDIAVDVEVPLQVPGAAGHGDGARAEIRRHAAGEELDDVAVGGPTSPRPIS